MGAPFWRGELDHAGQVDGEVGRAVGEGDAFFEGGVGVDLRGGDGGVVVDESLFEGLDGGVAGSGLEEDFRRAAPDHDDAIDLGFEFLDVRPKLLGEVALALARLDVGAVQALDVVLVEDGGHGLDGFEEGLDAGQVVLVEDSGVAGGFEHVLREDVPAGEDDVVEVGERDEVVDQRRAVVGALAQADGAHLGDGADGLGESLADGFNAGDEGGGDGAHADGHDAELALGRLNRTAFSACHEECLSSCNGKK